MYGCPEEIWAELAELPGGAQRIWRRAFWRAWPQAGGDCERAAALAWQAFALEAKGGGADSWLIKQERTGNFRFGKAIGAILAKVTIGWGVVRAVLGLRRRRQRVADGGGATDTAKEGQKANGRGRIGVCQGDLETVFAEAVARGWLKPEQRPWAEALARRDGQSLQEFCNLAAGAAEYQTRRNAWRRQRDDMT